jgi:hypothetical protein
MLRNSAWMLVLTVIVLMAGVVGCASTESNRSTRDSGYASGVDSASHGSCH